MYYNRLLVPMIEKLHLKLKLVLIEYKTWDIWGFHFD